MAPRSNYVYLFQRGNEDCYKVGHSLSPDDRRRKLSTGSNEKLTERRREPTRYQNKLETYIKRLLSDKRASNGEFFNVTKEEADAAFDEAIHQVTSAEPLIQQAHGLARQQPGTRRLRNASGEVAEIHQQLRRAKREEFLVQRRIECLEAKIKLEIGEDLGIDGIVTWDWRPDVRIDHEKLKQKRPRLYGLLLRQFPLDASSRRFDWAVKF